MKKTAQMLGVWLPLIMVMLAGCPNGSTDDEEENGYTNPKQLTTDWQLFYVKAVDSSRSDFQNLYGLERWHFHNNTYDGPVGLEIQKIFVSSTKSATIPNDAVMVVDFTQKKYDVTVHDAPFTESGVWTITTGDNGKATTGERRDTDYKYLGNVGTGAGVEAVYWGLVIRNVSATAKADSLNLTFDGQKLDSKLKSKPVNFAWLLNLDSGTEPEPEPEVDLTKWTSVYLQILDTSIDGFDFHGENGHIEIQKIFVNTTKSIEGAVTVFDFTASPVYTSVNNGGNVYWQTLESRIVDGGTGNGRWVYTGTGSSVHGGGFGSPALSQNSATYIGFIIKTDETGLGDVRFQPGSAGIVKFADMDGAK